MPLIRPPPPVTILETCLYVRSISESHTFYGDLLGLNPDVQTERLISYPVGSTSTLLLFQLGETSEDWVPALAASGPTDSSTFDGLAAARTSARRTDKPIRIPASGPTKKIEESVMNREERLNLHFCFGMERREDTETWEKYFEAEGVEIVGRMEWERGGYSIYVRDPDGGVVEFGSRGLWPHF